MAKGDQQHGPCHVRVHSCTILGESRARSINTATVHAYWPIGRELVEFAAHGAERLRRVAREACSPSGSLPDATASSVSSAARAAFQVTRASLLRQWLPDADRQPDPEVELLVEPEYSATDYFGNEGSDVSFYAAAAILFDVPPESARRRRLRETNRWPESIAAA